MYVCMEGTYFNNANRSEMLTNLFFGDRWIHTGHKNSILLRNHSFTTTAVTVTVAPCNGLKVMIRRTEAAKTVKKNIRVSTDPGATTLLRSNLKGIRKVFRLRISLYFLVRSDRAEAWKETLSVYLFQIRHLSVKIMESCIQNYHIYDDTTTEFLVRNNGRLFPGC